MKALFRSNVFWPTILTLILASGVFLALIVSPSALAQTTDDTPTTVDVHIYKKFSGDSQGYVESDFNFKITGDGFDQTVPHDSIVALTPGNYTIEEIVPDGLVKTDWRVGWYGDCEVSASNEYFSTIQIEESDLGQFNSPLPCEADNQYRPGDGDGGNGDLATLQVVKLVVGTSTSPDAFSFSVDGAAAVSFEADGTNELSVAAGTYDVVESPAPSGFNVSYDNCANVTLAAAETKTCTITNTLSGGNGGGNGTSTKEYRIEGYVWHDTDQNGLWPETEDPLEGWIVTITNGVTTATTSTNATGYYSFIVEAGTWTLSESVLTGWSQSFPSSLPQSYTVTVPKVEENNESITWFNALKDWLIPTAHAAVVETYSGFNFGNYYVGGGSGGDDGNGGSEGDDGNGGGGITTAGSGGRGGGGGTPKILGEQVSVVPAAALEAGVGGAAPNLPSALSWLWPLFAWLGF